MLPIKLLTSKPNIVEEDNLWIYTQSEFNKMKKECKERLDNGLLYLIRCPYTKDDNEPLSEEDITKIPDLELRLGRVIDIQPGYIKVVPISKETKKEIKRYVKNKYKASMRLTSDVESVHTLSKYIMSNMHLYGYDICPR